MKDLKIIHINDGTAKVLTNGNRHFVEEYEWAAEFLKPYLEDGYEILTMMPNVDPAIQGEGSFTFYRSGFTVILSK